MRELGYRDVWKRDLDWKIELALYRMLDEGLPAVMAGAGKRGGGHAWVVDGYYYYNMFDPGSGPTATDVIDAYGGRNGAKYELCTSVIGYRR